MKIYALPDTKDRMLMLQPGKEFPENSDWVKPNGEAILFQVYFVDGVAMLHGGQPLPSNLAQYMVDKGLASKTRSLIMRPRSHVEMVEDRPRHVIDLSRNV